MALLRFLPIILLFACTKPSADVYEILATTDKVDARMTQQQIDAIPKMMPVYDTADLFDLLAEFGLQEPDLVPMWNNYFQDGNCSTAKWVFISDGVPTWIIEDDTITTQNLVFQTWSPSGMPLCDGYIPACNGGHDCRVEVDYMGARFAREAIGYAQVNNAPIPTCELGVNDIEPSTNFWDGQIQTFEPYEFLVEGSLQWDLNGDNVVNTADLYIFLSQFGG